MDPAAVDDRGDCVEDTFDGQSFSPESSDSSDVFGELQVFPRVGDEYQVEIPPQITASDHLQFTKDPEDAENTAVGLDFLVGLAVPIMWINDKVECFKHEPGEAVGDSTEVYDKGDSVKPEWSGETHNSSEGNSLETKAEPTDSTLDNVMNQGESENVAMRKVMKIELQDMDKGKGCCPLPGSLGGSWSGIEEASFVLGLYIFGKNLVQVEKFVGSKMMGDILSFYYGKFYRSDRYLRWSECRKIRSRRCIYGQRIFTGLRQQELFSRLLPHVSEECQSSLMEASKAFGEGKISLEEYVFTLKASVGLDVLVEAVGIGKGKQDLTGIMEPLKPTQVAPVRPEIPIGKACATLTTLEIVNFLTGDFRLSKARSNDLFWEAVWPRLLARGWHSEQPYNNGCTTGSKHSLVFLIPGIKRFSRRKLVKGDHYFDSVSDVLSKVASDPELLELEIGVDNDCRNKEENGWTDETKLYQEDFPDQRRHCYLKPRTPNCNTDALKFTVVDTSLADEKTAKVREVRSLPSGVMNTCTTGSDSEEEDEGNSEESVEKSDSAGTLCLDRDEPRVADGNFVGGTSLKMTSLEDNALNKVFPSSVLDDGGIPGKIPNNQKTCVSRDRHQRRATKSQLSRKMGPDSKNHLPLTKRRRKLSACGRTETNHTRVNILRDPAIRQVKASGCAENCGSSENILSPVNKSEKESSISFPKGSIIISNEGILGGTTFAAAHDREVSQPRTLIDLNLPVPPDAEADEPFMTVAREREDETSKEPDDPSAVKPSSCVANSEEQVNSEEQTNVNYRRQSSRSRPLTTKALEALAFGYLDPKQKRKSRDTSPRDNSMLRPSRRARGQVTAATEDFGTGTVDFKVEERANGVRHNSSDMLTKLEV